MKNTPCIKNALLAHFGRKTYNYQEGYKSYGCIYVIINIPINKTTSYAKLNTEKSLKTAIIPSNLEK